MEGSYGDTLIPITGMHGDFNPYNFLLGENLNVIDWEQFRPEAIPFYDFFHYFTFSTYEITKNPYFFTEFIKSKEDRVLKRLFDFYSNSLKLKKGTVELFYPFYPVFMSLNDKPRANFFGKLIYYYIEGMKDPHQ